MHTLRALAFFPILLCTGCVVPTHTATRTVDLTIPFAELRSLACESHNGDITVTGDPGQTAVEVRATLSVRGYSDQEAQDNLHTMEVGQELKDGRLRLFGNYPTGSLVNRSPSFTFVIKVPANVALELSSHNGDLQARGTTGRQQLTTHNGDIDGNTTGSRVALETHNGRIGFDLLTSGPVDGSLESHNGDVEVRFGSAAGAKVAADTHNGNLRVGDTARDIVLGRRRLTCTIGDGTGSVKISTHNGNVHVR